MDPGEHPLQLPHSRDALVAHKLTLTASLKQAILQAAAAGEGNLQLSFAPDLTVSVMSMG